MAETLKIKDLPLDDRPREAFMRSAEPEREIPDASLLAILIRAGRKGSSAIDLAHRLINHFGGAANLVDATWQQIVAAKVPGVGKAVPKGWRQSRTAGVETDNGSALRSRLVHHSKTILTVDNLNLEDFACRFMIFSGGSVDMIAAVEAALIAEYTPLWNAVIDGFGNNDPGGRRMGGIVPKWHILHKGVKWASRMTGQRADVRHVQKSVMDYMMGLR